MVISMVITISLDLLLIPKIGIYGAATGATAGLVSFKFLSTLYAIRRGFIQLPKRNWWRILYVAPPLWGAFALDHPVILAALVLVSVILLFAVERVVIKDLAEAVKAIANRPAASRSQT